jgi:signal transduction histidine kinase
VVLAGWMLHIEVLTRLVLWGAPMTPLTAVAVFIAGIALRCATAKHRAWRLLAMFGAALIALLVLISSGARYVPAAARLERAVFQNGLTDVGLRVPVNTALALLLIAGGLATLAARRFERRRTPQYFAAGALVIAFVAFVGYAFGATGLYQPTAALGMSPWTVVSIHALALGIIFARTEVGFPALLTDPEAGGRLARRLFPAAVGIPFIVAWVVELGERAGVLEPYLSDSLITVLTVIALVWITERGARVVQRTDRERAQVFAREQHEREVAQQALIAAETASSAKSDFLAVMSHELRTPLTAIIGYEELLADGITGPLNPHQAQQLSRIKASAQHLLSLIDEILTFSRLEAGRETVALGIVDVNRVVEDSASLVSPLAGEKKLAFAVYPLDPPRAMRTDPGKLRQIFVNLLSNAVKFTAQGGVTVTTAVDRGDLVVRVCDTGTGIAPEHFERIFEPFWQAEQKATRRVSGTGLGLTVTRRLARLLGGDVTVESAPGQGTVFTARIPGVLPFTINESPAPPVVREPGAEPRAIL